MTTSLPIFSATPGSHETCRWKCGDACFSQVPNRSGNETFEQVVARGLSRRSFLKGGIASAIVLSTAGSVLTGTERALASTGAAADVVPRPGLRFTPIEPTVVDDVVVPRGYDWDILRKWGDPVLPGAPEWDFHHQTAQAQAAQFGYNNDYVAFFSRGSAGNGNRHGLLWVNHEYTNPELMFPDYDPDQPTREQVDIEMAAHGGSVLQIKRWNGRYRGYRHIQRGRFNRRITAETPMEITGPAAGAERMRTSYDPTGTMVRGMLNNCAGGTTPWGTVLTCEENFDQYFGNLSLPEDDPLLAIHERYGLESFTIEELEAGLATSERKWEWYHPRFDMSKEPNEIFRFGWVVEINPYDPDFTPRKRTALGRFKHEGATTRLTDDGRVAVYMGDDERFDYIYKFVSDGQYVEGDLSHNLDLLDSGTLYVAKFDVGATGEGIGTWMPLVQGEGPLTAENGFASQADVLINTRGAADLLGATAMDRPEDIQPNPVTGAVYAMLTNNTDRRLVDDPETPRYQGVDEANPRADNRWGHVIEWVEAGDDAAATAFAWRIFLLCGDPDDPHTYFAGFPPELVSPIAAPDNVMFDRRGNVWIATDGQPRAIGFNDAFHAVPAFGEERGHVQQFLSVPKGAEACGPELSPDNQTLFCAVQHPGEGGVFGSPLQPPVSDWPDRDPGLPPRPSLVFIYKSRTATGYRIGT